MWSAARSRYWWSYSYGVAAVVAAAADDSGGGGDAVDGDGGDAADVHRFASRPCP